MAKLLQFAVVIFCFAYAIRAAYQMLLPLIPAAVVVVIVITLLWFFLRRRR